MSTREQPIVTLRRVTSEDCDILFRWQQMPHVRRYARNPATPKWPEHCKWFETKLLDPDCMIRIIQDTGQDAGVVQLVRITELPSVTSRPQERYEVSIYLDANHAGRGIASAALSLIRAEAPSAILMAEVLPGNLASHALFVRAHYRPCGNGWYRSDPTPENSEWS